MKKKKKVEPDDPAQLAKFVEVAENIKADDADERFEEAFTKIIKAKPQRKVKPKATPT